MRPQDPALITRHPSPDEFVAFAPGFGQRFTLTIDTEEEFDWSKPLDRTSHRLDHIPRLAKFQQFCEGMGVVPIYLIDFPVASDPRCAEVLGDAVKAGRAEIGVQLHPWVNPPHEEHVNVHNSFAGNLPRDLERAMSFRQWNERSCRLGNALLGLGLNKGDRVAVLAYNCVEWCEIFAATAKAGLVALPINFRLIGKEVQFIVNNAEAAAVIVQDE